MKKNNRFSRILFLLIFIPGIFQACLAAQPEAAPDFTLEDRYGKSLTLSSYKNKQPVLLFFWTTWCPYCREQVKTLNKLYPKLLKDGIEVLALNLKESPERVEGFLKNYEVKYPVLLDSKSLVSYSYDIVGIPTYLLINKKGYIVFRDNYFPQEEYKNLLLEE
jgi:peroxiredoxin